MQLLLPHGLSPGYVVSKTTPPGSGYQTGQDWTSATVAHTIHIRTYTTPFASATIMGQHAAPEIFENDDWVFPEEFLREIAAAQMRYRSSLGR